MKLTIITADKAVYVDDEFIDNLNLNFIPADVHALQWDNDTGWIEFNNGSVNLDVTDLPDWAERAVLLHASHLNAPPAPIPPASAQENKERAAGLLLETDWVEYPSVTDVANNPHLLNKAEFDAYRLMIRQFVINPTAGDVVFPPKPAAEWSSR